MTNKQKDTLYLIHNYNSFQKISIENMASNFNLNHVFVRYKPIAEIFNLIPLGALSEHTKKFAINLNFLPSNVKVYPTPLWYLPLDKSYQKLGGKHFHATLKMLEKENIKFDLIHAHFGWSAGYVGMKLKEKLHKPLVITGHGYDIYDLPFSSPFWNKILSDVYNSADHIITVSQSNKNFLQKLKIRTPVTIIPNGVDLTLFKPVNKQLCRKNLKLDHLSNKKILLSIGSLEKIKGHAILIEAIKNLLKVRNDFYLIIIGDGSQRDYIQKMINKNKLSAFIKLEGKKNHYDLPYWYNSSDLFVLPSLRESFGIVQIEAMACGIPTVATMNGGSEEIINSDHLGFLVPVKDPVELSKKINLALNTKWNHEVIRETSSLYNLNNIRKKTLEVYDSIMDK